MPSDKKRAAPRLCSVDGCGRQHNQNGFCAMHWQRNQPKGYLRVHRALRRERGRASRYACVDCGRRATEWSFDTSDGRWAFSDDLQRYSPRCTRCHRRHDARARQPEALRTIRAVFPNARIIET